MNARVIDNWRDDAEPVWLAEARRDIGQRNAWPERLALDSHHACKARRAVAARPAVVRRRGGKVDAGRRAGAADALVQGPSLGRMGQALDRPAHGCVVVFERKGGGHVGLCVGEAVNGDLLILGGNQGDAVNIRAFPRARVLAYRWPPGRELPRFTQLAQGSAAATTGEA